MNQAIDALTPFCLGCGDWILEKPDIDDSPFYYCFSCTPKKKSVKNIKRSRNRILPDCKGN
jgi:hypothetical protein